jgi:ribosomal protein S27E
MSTLRWITARFNSKCAGCGTELYEGDRIVYDYDERAAYCRVCGNIEEEFQASQIDSFEDC